MPNGLRLSDRAEGQPLLLYSKKHMFSYVHPLQGKRGGWLMPIAGECGKLVQFQTALFYIYMPDVLQDSQFSVVNGANLEIPQQSDPLVPVKS